MPAWIRTHGAVLLGYACVAAVYFWPLPLHLHDALPGSASGDTGVYVWNLWVFRHEIVAHGRFPFFTLEVLPLTPAVSLALHNYTTATNIVGFFLIPLAGVVRTFNLLTIASPVLAAYAMFLLARRTTGDAGAAWFAGLAFGFSPFMNARATDHFSLVQAAPLPLFVLLFDRMMKRPTVGAAAATGATVGWAFLSDPYYAVYCVLIAGFLLASAAVQLQRARGSLWPDVRWYHAIDVLLVCLVGLIAGIVIRGGGRFEVLGLRVSMTHLYNPVLALTALVLVRLGLWLRPRMTWSPVLPPLRAMVTVGAVCAVMVAPVVATMGTRIADRDNWISPAVLWRSSAPGLDLLAFLLPNPLHPTWRGAFVKGLSESPGGFVENVASVPWTLIGVIAVAITIGVRLPRRWIAWTGFFTLLALGPFITIGGIATYVPTPWALLRYVPVIGAARMPPRFAVLVVLGVAMLAAIAVRGLRRRSRHPRLVLATVALLLVVEALPAPRILHSAAIPRVYEVIAADRRDVRVLNLPFGLRDGLSSHGNTTAAWQFYQTLHEKPIMGGYLSRLSARDVATYRRGRVTRVLMDLSAGRDVSDDRFEGAIVRAREARMQLNIGYVVVNVRLSPPRLQEFARRAFELTYVASDGDHVLYRTPLASNSRP